MRLCCLRRIGLWCIVSVAPFVLAAREINASEIDGAAALRLIVAKEKEISSFRWECRKRGPHCPPEGNLSKVAFDSSGRFRMQALAIDPVYDDNTRTFKSSLGVDDLKSFDGEVYRRQLQREPGQSLPGEKTKAVGFIKKEERIAFQGSAQEGIQYFFPCFFPLDPFEKFLFFSEYLKNRVQSGFPLWVNENKEGVWEISTISKEVLIRNGEDKFSLYLHVLYDPGRGKAGAILKVVESPHRDFAAALEHKTGNWQEVSYNLQEVSGFWVPRLVRCTYGWHGSGPVEPTEYSYSNVELNRPLTKEDFVIRWKKGTFVTDDITKQTYIASDSPVNEKKAVDLYANAHGLNKPGSLQGKRSRYVLWVGFALLTVSACIFVLRRWRKWRGASPMVLWILAAIALASRSLPCQAEEVKRQERQPNETFFEFDDGWWRVCDGRREARITQCAFYVTVFVLNYLDVSCDPILVSENLPASLRGVSLDRIQRVLQAHGLQAEGRKGVRLSDLLKLRDDECAILALPVPKVGDHYFVIANGEEGLYCADVPNRVSYFDEMTEEAKADIEQRLAARQGIILLARRGSVAAPLSQSISVSSERVNLGDFLVKPVGLAKEAISRNVVFKNTSSRPVAVSLKTSCGCIAGMTWRNKIIDAGSEETLTISVSPTVWGVGRRAETVLVVLPDSSHKAFSIVGTGHGGQGTKLLHLTSSKELRLQVAGSDARTYETTAEIGVFASPDISSGLKVESNAAWIRPTIKPSMSKATNLDLQRETHRVLCTVHGSEEVLDELCRNDNSISALVTVTAKPNGPQAQFSVALTRKPLLRVEPNIVTIANGQSSKTVRIRENGESSPPISNLTAAATPEGLSCSIHKDGDAYLLEIRPMAERKTHHFVITCRAEFENGDRDEGTIIASINNN